MGALAIAGNSGNSGIVQQFASPFSPEWLEVEITTTAPNQTYSWQASAGTSVSSTTDWGDGSGLDTQAGVGIRTKTYAAAGVYTVRVQASFGFEGAMNMRPNTDRARLTRLLGPIPGFQGLSSLLNFATGCFNLRGTIPGDLLRYVTQVTNLQGLLFNCQSLTGEVPENFFGALTQAVNFTTVLASCRGLQLQPNLFGPNPGSFFAARTPNFSSAFANIGIQEGTPQGTAPPLWEYTYGGAPTTTNCFTLNSATHLSNWAQIPAAWGGPA